jgi:LysM repeat protein
VESSAEPSQTSEASLTPIIHVVQSGDTLLGIALEYGVDLDTLRQANGNLDPRSLQIGQELIIPNEPGTTSVAAATSTPLAIPLDPPTCYETSTMTLLCLGQMVNILERPVERTAVAVQLLQADGRVLVEESANTEQTLIQPGQAAPYRVVFASGWEGYTRVVAVVLSADSAQRTSEQVIQLIIENEAVVTENGHYIVSATLRNPEAQMAQTLRVVITLYDNDKRVVGYRVLELDSPLLGGARLPIEVEVVPQVEDDALTHTLYAEAWRGS